MESSVFQWIRVKGIPLLLGIAIFLGLYLCSACNFLLFHTLAEVFSIAVSWGMFFIIWNTRHRTENSILVFIGTAYFFAGVIDVLHVLAYKGMGVFPGHDADLPTQLWIAARYVQVGSLAVAPWVPDLRHRWGQAFAGYCAVCALLVVSIFSGIFPHCYLEGAGLTPFKKGSEYLLCVLIVLAGVGFHRRKAAFDQTLLKWLLLSLGATFVSEMCFTFYVSVYGLSNLIGHYFKILSMWFMYRAVIENGLNKPLEALFREHKQYADSLRESEARYRQLSESSLTGIFIHQDGKAVYVNTRMARMLGYTPDEIIGRPFLDTVHPEDREWVAERSLARLRGEQVPEEYELRLLTKDENVIWVKILATLIDHRGPAATMGNLYDITDRKNAEKGMRLRDSAITSAISGITMVDQTGSLIYANPSVLQLWGYEDEKEVLSRNALEFWASKSEAKEAYKIAAQTGRWVGELVARRKDGTQPDVQTAISVIRDPSGKPVAVMGSFLDITERKKAERALRESESRYRVIFDNSPDGILITDIAAKRFTYANPSVCRMLGYTPQELTKLGVADIHPQDRLPQVIAEFDAVARGEKLLAPNIAFLRKDETVFYADISSLATVIDGMVCNVGFVRDITERKTADEALQASEDRYRQLTEDSLTGIFIHQDGIAVFANPRLADMLGYTKEEMIGRKVFEGVHPEDHETVEARVQARLRGEPSTMPHQLRLLKKTGEEIWCEILATAIDYQGRPAIMGNLVDITSHKKAEGALRESEERYRYLVENIEDFICTHDLKGNLLFVSPGPAKALGFDPAEMVGANLRSHLAPDVRNQFDDYLAAVERDGRARGYMLVRSADGENRVWEYRNTLNTGKDGQPEVIGVARDVTERRRSERTIKRLVTAIDQATEGVLITNPQGTIEYVNPGLERMTGYTRDELIGQTSGIMKSGEHDEMFYRQMWETIEAGKTWHGQFTNRRKDGTLYHEDATISPVKDGSGKIVNYVAVKRDITEHLELSKQLVQAQKMEAVGTLAGGVAHDFNNILQVAVGYSELMLDDVAFPSQYRADLKKIHESANRGADLVRRLLTFSKKTEPEARPLSLNRRISELRKMLERTIPKMIEVRLGLSERLAAINADPTQIDQILMNIAVNAQHAMPDGGKLIIETANTALDEEYARAHINLRPGRYVLLTVSDTGVGMDHDTLEHIFEPFFTTKETGKGTGLGLAMVHAIVEQHAGHITCQSAPGHGTTFKIFFPALISDEEKEETTVPAMPRRGSETVMLVDDEEYVRDLGSKILTRGGYTVIAASSGKKALEVYEERGDEIALVVLDLIMPEIGGRQCLEALVKLDPYVKVVIASGFSADTTIKEALAAGAKGFMDKPYNMRKVLEVVRRVLDDE